jgi:hypothetical protein
MLTVRHLGIAVLGVVGILIVAADADARITKIQITTKESPTFGGYSWPGVGQYEKIVGKAFGEVDPADPKNAVIVDILLAPRNANGRVEYAFDFYILKPIDLTKGAHKVVYEPPNRGSKTWTSLARVSSGGDDPGSIVNPTELANSFLMPRGYTMVWSGWDFSAGTDNSDYATTMTFPIAKNRDGSSITGPAYEYIVSQGAAYALNYPAATLDQAKATLTHRVRLNDTPQVVPRIGMDLQRRRHGDQPVARRHAVHRQRHLRVFLHREGSDGERSRLRGRPRLERVPQVRDERRCRRRQSAGRRRHQDLHRSEVPARPHAQRLPDSWLQPG